MSTLWVVVGPGCTGLVEAETLPRGDFMTLLGQTIVIIVIINALQLTRIVKCFIEHTYELLGLPRFTV